MAGNNYGQMKGAISMRKIKVHEQEVEAAKAIGKAINNMSCTGEGIARSVYNHEHPTLMQGFMRISMALVWDLADDTYYDGDLRLEASKTIAKAIKKSLVEQGLGTEDFPPALPFI
jgi:hypothetical protein